MYEAHWTENPPERDQLDRSQGKILLEFGAEYCPHCQVVQALVADKMSGNDIPHFKIADGKGRKLGRSFGVKLWPNFVMMHRGSVVEQLARPELEELERSLMLFSAL